MNALNIIARLVGAAVIFIGSLAMAAEIDAARSEFDRSLFGKTSMIIGTSEVTPMKTRYLDAPYRVIFEFEGLDFGALPSDFGADIKGVEAVNFGNAGQVSRMVVTFDEPKKVKTLDFSAQAVEGEAGLSVEFEDISEEDFANLVQNLQADRQNQALLQALPEDLDESLPLIVIDPGHGGIDPGALRFGIREKDVTLQAAKTIQKHLQETGRYEVVLTREGDQYLSLINRRQFAERVGGDVLLSIHADTVEIGVARGTTIYKLSDKATSQIAAHFARFENRVDLFAGEDLPKDESDISVVLTDMAHQESREKADLLANILQKEWVQINVEADESRIESAAFAVLKAPEIPSLLLEIGYLSNEEDVKKILDLEWQSRMADGIVTALDKYFE